MPTRGGGKPHQAPCRCGHGVHTTHVVEPMCVCSSCVMCLRHAQGRAMVPPWCGQGFSWWFPHLSHLLPPLKSNTDRFHCFLRKHQYVWGCIMEYNFNYKLKFQVPQPSSAPPKLGVCARCPSDAHVVHVWLSHSARLARPWCTSGSPTVSSHGSQSLNHQTSKISLLSS